MADFLTIVSVYLLVIIVGMGLCKIIFGDVVTYSILGLLDKIKRYKNRDNDNVV